MRTARTHCKALAAFAILLLRWPVVYGDVPAYEIIDLGTNTTAHGLNNLGQVVGEVSPPNSPTHAFLSAPNGGPNKELGQIQDIGTLGSYSIAHGINDSGLIVGEYGLAQGFAPRAFISNPNGGSLFDINGPTSSRSVAYGINNAGQVVGYNTDASGFNGAFIREPNSVDLTDIATLYTDNNKNTTIRAPGVAYAVNTTGHAAGAGTYFPSPGFPSGIADLTNNSITAFLSGPDGAALTSLGGFDPVKPSSTAYGINNQGIVVGSSQTANGETHAFFSNGLGLSDLGSLGGTSIAYDINNGSNLPDGTNPVQVVGQSDVPNIGSHAFVWDQTNGLVDLNLVVDADAGATFDSTGVWLTSATAINDHGQIAANGGYKFNGSQGIFFQRSFLLTPKPLSADGKNLGLSPSDVPPIETHRQATGGAVNVATGNKILVETDYVGGTGTGLVFRRYYNSQGRGFTAFGAKWRCTYDRSISIPVNNRVQATRADGRVEVFTLTNGRWVGDPDVTDSLSGDSKAGWILVTADDIAESYSPDGKLTQIITPAGLSTTLSYDELGHLITVTGPFGHKLTFAYDQTSGAISSMTTPGGTVYSYSVQTLLPRKGILTDVSYSDFPRSFITRYSYGDPANPGAITDISVMSLLDELSHFTFTYDAKGRLISSGSDGGIDSITLDYNDSAGTTTVTDARGSTRSYTFQNQFNVLKTTALAGAPCSSCVGKAFSYDGNGFIASRTDYNGNVTTYTHNVRGLETSRIEASGKPESRTITTAWDNNFHLPTQVTEPNRVTTFNYDENGNLLTRKVNASNQSRLWTYTYNNNGQVTSVDGPRNDVNDITRYTYGANGALASVTDALGHLTQISAYDSNNWPLTIQDPNGLTTNIEYDSKGRKVSVDVGGLVTTYTYNGLGRLTSINHPSGESFNYTYDVTDRLTTVVDSWGFTEDTINYINDAFGNVLEEQVSAGTPLLPFAPIVSEGTRTHSYTYDAQNRVLQSIGSQGQVTAYDYDANSNLIQVTDPLNKLSKFTYDPLNRRTATIDASGAQTQATYDTDNHPLSVKDARGLVTSYTYDGLGNLTSITSPDTGSTTLSYDSADNLLSQPDAKGLQTNRSYDALNRVTQIRYPGIAPTNFSYDQGTTGIGRLTRMADSTGSTAWVYDEQGRVAQKTQQVGALTLTVKYSYDPFGNPLTITYPSGRTVILAHIADKLYLIGADGKPISVNAYQPFGPPIRWSYSGVPNTRTADTDGRLSDYTLAARTRTLNYDAANRITEYKDTDPSFNQSFNYDALSRITEYTGNSITESYGYDDVGNRTSYAVNSTPPINYTYATDSNRLLDATIGTQPRSYTYDPIGNITGDTVNQYTYDGQNRLTQALVGQQLYAYWLNGRGQRVAKSLGKAFDLGGDANLNNRLESSDLRLIAQMAQGQITVNLSGDCNHDGNVTLADVTCTQSKIANLRANPSLFTAPPNTYFFYDEAGHLIGEYDTNGLSIQETVWMGDTPVAVMKPTPAALTNPNAAYDVFYIYADHLNAPRVITDQQNKVVWNWESNPFGIGQPTSSSGFVYNLRFPGQYFDSETGLIHNGFRDYDPQIGRYIQSDPIGLGGGINTYNYVGGRPVNGIDPLGLTPSFYNPLSWDESDWIAAGTGLYKGAAAYADGVTSIVGVHLFYSLGVYSDSDPGIDVAYGLGIAVGTIDSFLLPEVKVARPASGALSSSNKLTTVVDNVIAETLAGKGNITSSVKLSADELLNAGEQFLGNGYREIGKSGSGVFRSADDLRQFRIDDNSLLGNHAPGVPHGHLEIYAPGAAKPSVNNHIPFID